MCRIKIFSFSLIFFLISIQPQILFGQNPCYNQQTGDGLPILTWMLEGGINDYANTYFFKFGSEWRENCSGVVKLHSGWDMHTNPYVANAMANKIVYAAYEGTVEKIYDAGGAANGKGLVISHISPSGVKFTTTYIHLKDIPDFEGQKVCSGEFIGLLDENVLTEPHIHFQLRKHPYSSVSHAGALPQNTGSDCECTVPGFATLPEFPEYFVDPNELEFYKTPNPCLDTPFDIENAEASIKFEWSHIPTEPTDPVPEYRLQVYKASNSSPSYNEDFGFTPYSNSNCENEIVVNINVGSSTFFDWNNLVLNSICELPEPNTTYYWTVKAYLPNKGSSIYSIPKSFNTISYPEVLYPINAGSVPTNTNLDWTNVNNASNYTIQIVEGANGGWTRDNGFLNNPTLQELNSTSSSLASGILNLNPATQYYWTVKADNSYFSDYSFILTDGQSCPISRSSNSSCIDLKLNTISTNSNLYAPGSTITINTSAELVPPNAPLVNGTLVYNLINTSTNQVYYLGDDNFAVGDGTGTDPEALTVNLPNLSSGFYTVQITIDPTDQISEFNEDNNQIDKAIVIIANPGDPPDGIILNAQVNPSSAQSNQTLTASGTVLYDNGDPVDFQTVTILSQGQSWTVNTNAMGAFNRQISAPQNSSNINFTVSDGNFTGTDQVYVSIQQNNNSGPYNPHFFTVCRYVNGSGWSDATTHVKDNFSRVYIWEEYIDVNVPIRTRTTFYKPSGVKYFDYVGDWSPGDGGDWLNWVYMDVADELASDWQGTWQIKIETQEPGESWVVTKNLHFILSHLLAEQRMCKDVNPTTYAPITPTNEFTQNDNMAIAWNKFTDISNEVEVRAEWIEPNGSVYADTAYTIDDPGWETNAWYPTIYQWNYIFIKNDPAENKTGCWKVNIYTKDPFNNWDLEYIDNFKIFESPDVLPQANVNPAQTQFTEGENVRLNISASDNTYLKEVILHWYDGDWHERVWADINASSRIINNFNLGSYDEGVYIDYYVEAWDNSDNYISSAWKNLLIQDSDTSPPQISDFLISDVAGNNDGVLDDEDEHLLASFSLTDPSGVDEVRFFLDGIELLTINAYEVDLGQVNTGQHFINVFAKDGDTSPESELYSFTFNVIEYCQGNLLLDTISQSEYKSAASIETNGAIILDSNQSVILRSNHIKLKSGYHAKPGSVMEIKVDPCIQSN